jgi:CheY-like chemotaxis protein
MVPTHQSGRSVPFLWAGTGDASPRPAGARASSDPEATGDPFRVLLVDDEQLIRRMAGGMAARLRIELIAVASAAEAVAVAQTTRLDALVADVLLGAGQDGIELAREMAALQPWMAVILMSGYSADDFTLEGLPADTQFLSKPFSSHSLAACLARARGQSGSTPH